MHISEKELRLFLSLAMGHPAFRPRTGRGLRWPDRYCAKVLGSEDAADRLRDRLLTRTKAGVYEFRIDALDILSSDRLPPWVYRDRDGHARQALPEDSFGIRCFTKINRPVLQGVLSTNGRLSTRIRAALLLAASKSRQLPEGELFTEWTEATTGRLFASGPNLQGIGHGLRKAALFGIAAAEYDIHSCALSLLRNLTKPHAFDAIDDAVDNKEQFRTQLANELAVSVGQVKTACAALLFGARLDHHSPSLLDILGGPDGVERFRRNPRVRAFDRDIERARKLVLDDARHRQGDFYVNAVRKTLPSDNPPGKALTHILQGAERACLDAVIRTFGTHLLVPCHDGWILDRYIAGSAIETVIERESGFQVGVSAERLSWCDLSRAGSGCAAA